MGFKRKMAGVEKVNLRVGVIAGERFGTRGQEEWIGVAPYRKQWWALSAKVILKLRVQRDVVRVIEEQVKLDIVIPRPCQ